MDIDNVPPDPRDVFASQEHHRDSLRYLSDGVLHDQNIRHCPELSKILPEPLLVCLPAQATNKQLPGRRVGVRCAATTGLALQNGTVNKIISLITFFLFCVFSKVVSCSPNHFLQLVKFEPRELPVPTQLKLAKSFQFFKKES